MCFFSHRLQSCKEKGRRAAKLLFARGKRFEREEELLLARILVSRKRTSDFDTSYAALSYYLFPFSSPILLYEIIGEIAFRNYINPNKM